MILLILSLLYIPPLIKCIIDIIQGSPIWFLIIGITPIFNWIIFMDDGIS